MDTKIAGGILLIVGTSIGAGMLALPLVAAVSGFFISSLILLACWSIMTFGAFLMLEVNLWLPPRNNIISMSRATLGPLGAMVAWLSYFLLLYSLLAAYISGGSDLFYSLLSSAGIKLPRWIDAAIFVLIFGYIVFRGIQPVDYVNRLLMITKFGSFFVLIVYAMPSIDHKKLVVSHPVLMMTTVTVMLTSFGFANIIPSLRSYYNHDVKKLRRAIIVGSLIPLFCYLIWDFVILGTLSHDDLVSIMQQGGSVAELTQLFSTYLNSPAVSFFAHLFTTICVLTSFLCVSLSLSDFLADGLKIEKQGFGNWIINALTFLPSLLIVIFYPSLFIKALNYGGICCAILVILLPALMVLSGRYFKKNLSVGHYQVIGGKWSVVLLAIVSVLIIVLGIVEAV